MQKVIRARVGADRRQLELAEPVPEADGLEVEVILRPARAPAQLPTTAKGITPVIQGAKHLGPQPTFPTRRLGRMRGPLTRREP